MHGGHQRLRPVGRAELVIQARYVSLGRGLAHEHCHRDSGNGQPVTQQVQYFPFPVAEGEPVLHRMVPGERRRQSRRGERRGGDGGVPYGCEHLFQRCGHGDEGRDSGLQGLEQDIVFLLRGEYDDTEVCVAVPELPGEPQAIAVGQLDLHGHHVRLNRGDHALGVGRRRAFGHYLNVRMPGDELAQAIARERLSIN
jgi:hypothetical protein